MITCRLSFEQLTFKFYRGNCQDDKRLWYATRQLWDNEPVSQICKLLSSHHTMKETNSLQSIIHDRDIFWIDAGRHFVSSHQAFYIRSYVQVMLKQKWLFSLGYAYCVQHYFCKSFLYFRLTIFFCETLLNFSLKVKWSSIVQWLYVTTYSKSLARLYLL